MTSQAYTLSQIVSQLGGEWKGEDIAITAVRPVSYTHLTLPTKA